MEPPVEVGFVLLDASDHLLELEDRLVVTLELLTADGSLVAVESLGELVIFLLDAFVFAFANLDVKRSRPFTSSHSRDRAEGALAHKGSLRHIVVHAAGQSGLSLRHTQLFTFADLDKLVEQNSVFLVHNPILLYV